MLSYLNIAVLFVLRIVQNSVFWTKNAIWNDNYKLFVYTFAQLFKKLLEAV